MTIRFLHGTPLEFSDRLCQEEQKVRIVVEVYRTETTDDGFAKDVIVSKFGSTIKSSKDLFQFDDEDIRFLTEETKDKLR
jgi:hypothetical protein